MDEVAPYLQLKFGDGNGNAYDFVLKEKDDKFVEFTYTPVKQLFSSSGLYSGSGEELHKMVDTELFKDFYEWLVIIRNSKVDQTSNRAKGTGIFSLFCEGGLDGIFILQYQSKTLNKAMELLDQFRYNED